MARGLALISAIIVYSMAYGVINVIDNFVIVLAAHIQVSVLLIGTIKKGSIKHIVMAM